MLALPSMRKLDIAGFTAMLPGLLPSERAVAAGLAHALQDGSNVQVLGLDQWLFTDEEIVPIARGLARCKHLRAVRFTQGDMSDDMFYLLMLNLEHVEDVLNGEFEDDEWYDILHWNP